MSSILVHRCDLVYGKAEQIARHNPPYPYVFGGGRNPPFTPSDAMPPFPQTGLKGYDCSSGASTCWRAGGMLSDPPAHQCLATGDFMTWGKPGPGRLVTLAVRNDSVEEHCFIIFNLVEAKKQKLDWKHPAWAARHTGTVVGWQDEYDTTGFELRHWELNGFTS